MRPQVSPTMRPVSVEPVNEMTGMSGCSTIAVPTALADTVHELDHLGRQPRLEQDLDEHASRCAARPRPA